MYFSKVGQIVAMFPPCYGENLTCHMNIIWLLAQNITNRGTARIWHRPISLATFSIKMVGKLKLSYQLLFINVHKDTKLPLSVHQNLQPANINGYTARCLRGYKTLKFTILTLVKIYWKHIHSKGKTLWNYITVH